MIPNSFIDELKHRCDIEQVISPYTRLKRAGRNLTGLCPFHSEKTPSFVVYPENGSFYCFGCGAGGDVVTFVRMAEHLEYMEALRFLAQKAGIAMPEDIENDQSAKQRVRILECNREAARFFYQVLNAPLGKAGLEYFNKRHLSEKTVKKFGLGFAPDTWDALIKHLKSKGFTEQEAELAALTRKNRQGGSYDLFRNRVMFPIIDLRGSVIGFGGRTIGSDNPKYINSPDTMVFKKSRGLFGLNIAKATKQQYLILCEGYMDTIGLHQAGFDNAVATLGTALTGEQARLIAQYTGEVVIAYDSDEAGQKATERAVGILSKTGIKIRVLSMSGAKDPDEYISKFGVEKFRQLLEGSTNSTEHEILKLRKKHDTDSDDGKVNFLNEFCVVMSRIPAKLEADVYINKIANEFSVSKDAIVEQVNALRRKMEKSREKKIKEDLHIFAEENKKHGYNIQRSGDIGFAAVEDKLITALFKNPNYINAVSGLILPEEFATDSNREIYDKIIQTVNSGTDLTLTYLSPYLPIEEMGRLSGLLASARDLNYTFEDVEKLVSAIKQKQGKKTNEQIAAMDEQELKRYFDELAAKKK